MYNNTNTDVKVPVEVSPQLGNRGKKQRKHAHLCCSVWILILYLWCCILLDD